MAEGSSDSRTYTLPLQDLPINLTLNTQGRIPEELEQVLRQVMVERRSQAQVVGPGGNASAGNGPNNNTTVHFHRALSGHHHQHSHDVAEDASAVIQMPDGDQEPDGDDNGHQHEHDGPTGPRDWRAVWKLVESSMIFVVIMSAKLLYDHRLGILVFAGLLATYWHANSTLKTQIALRENRRYGRTALVLLWIILLLTINIWCVYYMFDKQLLYKSLMFMLPNFPRLDLWLLLWVVGITDYVVRYATIILKAVVAVIPKSALKFRKRGKYYLLIEEVSQTYRSLLPILPWFYFLTDTSNGGPWFSAVLLIVYVLCKANVLLKKVKELLKAVRVFRNESSFGCQPSQEAMNSASDSCPICHDQFQDPIMLRCTHIFCEDCVSMWFDREKTCPMCRAEIVESPVWRDGSTSPYIQLF